MRRHFPLRSKHLTIVGRYFLLRGKPLTTVSGHRPYGNKLPTGMSTQVPLRSSLPTTKISHFMYGKGSAKPNQRMDKDDTIDQFESALGFFHQRPSGFSP